MITTLKQKYELFLPTDKDKALYINVLDSIRKMFFKNSQIFVLLKVL